MKRFCVERVLPLLFMFVFLSCEQDQGSKCKLYLNFSSEYDFLAMKQLRDNLIKRGVTQQMPDTNDFILSIVDAADRSVYYGTYKDRPEELLLDEGGYTISVVSIEQTVPLFNAPQYGDTQVIFLQNGENMSVAFLCKHINSGIKINYSSEFKRKYPTHITTLKSEDYLLQYPYSETRIAYFSPARIELLMKKGSEEEMIFSKDMAAGSVLTINLTANTQSSGKGFNIIVDTSKLWITEDIVWGDNNEGDIEGKALTVREAKKWVGAKEIWIKGYIVGGDLSSSKMSSVPPFKSATNFAISDNKNEISRDNCMSVELKSGEVREALNLVTHPYNLRKLVFIKGEVVDQYFGLEGVKNVKGFRIN